MSTRRDFVRGLAVALGGLTPGVTQCGRRRTRRSQTRWPRADRPRCPTDPTSARCFPSSGARRFTGEFPLSFLRDEFRELPAWKPRRGASCSSCCTTTRRVATPAEVVERVDQGEFVREDDRLQHHARPPRPRLCARPKALARPAPAVVVLHDHGGMYLWGQEKVVEAGGEHPVLADFKRRFYAGKSIATELVRRGYVVIAIDMFYWGERPDAPRRRPGRLARAAADVPAARVAEFNRRASQFGAARRPDDLHRRASPGRA